MTDFIGNGWSFPLRINSNGGIGLVSHERELEEAMTLILSTYPGERVMRPQFGCRLRDYVFDGSGLNTIAALSTEVRNSLLRWEPRINVDDVIVTNDPDEQSLLYIDIRYSPKNSNDKRNLVFPFYTIPEDGSEY